MNFLDAGDVMVQGKPAVPVLREHNQHAERKADDCDCQHDSKQLKFCHGKVLTNAALPAFDTIKISLTFPAPWATTCAYGSVTRFKNTGGKQENFLECAGNIFRFDNF